MTSNSQWLWILPNICTSTRATITMENVSTVTPFVVDVVSSVVGSNFHALDYVLFAVLLSVSMSIGVYFGYFNSTEQTTDEYLLGGRNMQTIPIAISLIASQLSALTIISLPAEGYAFGSHNMIALPPMFLMMTLIINYAILPVFYECNVDNCYEYLEMRFGKFVRGLVTWVFFIIAFLIMPITSYLPSLTFAQMTGLNLHAINAVVSTICVLYTMMGGIKAVVWTDVIQASIMVFAVGVVVVTALIRVGGLDEVVSRAISGGRLTAPIFELNLTTRQTMWSCTFGSVFLWVSHCGLNQSCVQRLVALPSLGHARRAMTIFCCGIIGLMVSNAFIGVIMYAYYHDCDPLQAGAINKIDELVPYFVNDVVGHIAGMPGLFISCVFSASMSTISAYLNALAGIIYQNYICCIPGFTHTDTKANLYMKSIVVIVGAYCFLFGFVLQRVTSIFALMYTMAGMVQGASCGVFLLGMFYPKANNKSAIWGTIASLLIMAWIVFGGKIYRESNHIEDNHMHTTIDGCADRNITIEIVIHTNVTSMASPIDEPVSTFYTISFTWYSLIGAAIVILVGIPLSHLIGEQNVDQTVDDKLISPLFRFLLPKSTHLEMQAVISKLDVTSECNKSGATQQTTTYSYTVQ